MLNRRQVLLSPAALVPALTLGTTAFAGPKVYAPGGVAIKGYDPVAYFKQEKPVKGSNEHSTKWNGATWRFASAENLADFEADPVKYAPKYGGHCAYAMARGDFVQIDPAAWDIVDGALYLNYSKSVWAIWAARKSTFISRADARWPH